MIELDSSTWRELRDAYGPATEIPAILRRVADGSGSVSELYDAFALIERGAVSDAALASVPHLTAIAKASSAERRHDILTLIGRIAFAADSWLEDEDRAFATAAALARADLALTPHDKALDLLLAILAIEKSAVLYDAVSALSSGELPIRCPADTCGVEIAIADGVAHVDELSTPVTPSTDRDALGGILQLLIETGHGALAQTCGVIAGTIECPKCNEPFSVLAELLDPHEL